MASPRYDVARAFMAGKPAANSTRSFRSVHEPEGMTAIYTYGVCLARRAPDGTLYFPRATPDKRTLDTKYSQTSSIHQKAVRVILTHPTFGDWRPNRIGR